MWLWKVLGVFPSLNIQSDVKKQYSAKFVSLPKSVEETCPSGVKKSIISFALLHANVWCSPLL